MVLEEEIGTVVGSGEAYLKPIDSKIPKLRWLSLVMIYLKTFGQFNLV